MPTPDELNTAAPETPVFVLNLYQSAVLNGAALRALGMTRDTPDPPGGVIERDGRGKPTGLLVAKPDPLILYSSLARAPTLSPEDRYNSSRQFMRELNRLGVTSVSDAGGGGQNYPTDYATMTELARQGQLTVRIAYTLFPQRPGQELDDFSNWMQLVRPGDGNDFYRLHGAGEMLVWTGADFENFAESRPELGAAMEARLAAVVGLLVRNRWPFRLHATYDESIRRFLTVFERVNREVPFAGLRWNLDHAEMASPRSLERVVALGGGVAVQDRMVFQGEDFVARYGAQATADAPPIRRMLQMGIPVGSGTDATRVSSYNPWLALSWLVTGRTAGGVALYPASTRLDRTAALRLMTAGSAWFSGEEAKKGTIEVGRFADFAVLADDYFSVPEERIPLLESVLTVVGGTAVYGAGDFARLAPPALTVTPSWSPPAHFAYAGQPAGH